MITRYIVVSANGNLIAGPFTYDKAVKWCNVTRKHAKWITYKHAFIKSIVYNKKEGK